MGYFIYTFSIWVLVNQEESMLGVSSECTEDFNCGPIWVTKSKTPDLSGRNLSKKLLTLPVLLLRRLPSRLSSQTLPLESVSEFSSRRTTRESPLTYQEMVVWVSSMRTPRSSSLVSVDLDTLRVIFPVSDSRSSNALERV